MVGLFTEQGVALYLQKENAQENSYISVLESLHGRPVVTCHSWAEALKLAEQHNVSVFMLDVGVEPANEELQKLNAFVILQPDCIRVAVYTTRSFFNRASYAGLCNRLIKEKDEAALLEATLKEAARTRRILSQDKLRNNVAEISHIPQFPQLSVVLSEKLLETACNARRIAEVLNNETALAKQLISQVNDACFILQNNTKTLIDAINEVGTRQAHYMVLANQIFSQLPQPNSWSSFAFDHIRERSLLVAGLTQKVCESVKAPVEIADQAFLAALLQDLGLLIFAVNFPDRYQRIMQEASDLKQPLYAVEKLRMCVSHTEVCAYILSQWRLPPAVIEAVLFHHFPASSKNDEFSVMTALHVADAILPNVTNVLGCQVSGRLNIAYLERLGLGRMVNQWQKAAVGYKTSHPGCGGVVCSFA